jgi:hypothetical protein
MNGVFGGKCGGEYKTPKKKLLQLPNIPIISTMLAMAFHCYFMKYNMYVRRIMNSIEITLKMWCLLWSSLECSRLILDITQCQCLSKIYSPRKVTHL